MQNTPLSSEPTEFQEINYEQVETNPNNPPWSSGIAILIWIASVLLIFLVPALFLAPYLIANGGPGMNQTEMARFAVTDPTAVLIQIGAIFPAHLLTLLMCWLVVTNRNRFAFLPTLGWKSGGMRWWHYVAILGGFFVFMVILGAFFPEQENDLIRILKSSRWAVYVIALLAVFTAPVIEEVVYRGVLFSAFQRSVGMPLAVLLVTLLFAVVHVPQYYPSYVTIVLLTVLSLILTLVRARTDNLLPCIILHTIFNGLQSLMLLLNPETLQPGPVPIEKAAIFLSW